MLAEMKGETAARHLHVDRRVCIETGLPIDLEAEEIEVELAGFLQ
jgi:hypothetical protein